MLFKFKILSFLVMLIFEDIFFVKWFFVSVSFVSLGIFISLEEMELFKELLFSERMVSLERFIKFVGMLLFR